MRKNIKTAQNEKQITETETIANDVPATVKVRFLNTYTGGLGVFYKNSVYELPYNLLKVFEKNNDVIKV
jgi:hypothetical protein